MRSRMRRMCRTRLMLHMRRRIRLIRRRMRLRRTRLMCRSSSVYCRSIHTCLPPAHHTRVCPQHNTHTHTHLRCLRPHTLVVCCEITLFDCCERCTSDEQAHSIPEHLARHGSQCCEHMRAQPPQLIQLARSTSCLIRQASAAA
jgi:hypothetical protein